MAFMTDVFTFQKRSEVMSKIRGRGNKSTEMAMVAVLKRAHLTGWRRHVELRPWPAPEDGASTATLKSGRIRVRPDFIFQRAKLALFVDGCFWHGCPLHSTKPKQNAVFWDSKLRANSTRDAQHTRALEAAGWTVLRVWEHELRDADTLAGRVVGVFKGI